MNALEKTTVEGRNRRCRAAPVHPQRDAHRRRPLVAADPVWLCVVGDELILLAVARRRYVRAHRHRANAAASHYSHATGELVIEPGEAPALQSPCQVSPRDALRVLEFSNRITNPEQPNRSTETKT